MLDVQNPPKMGRPSEFSDEVFAEICERMAGGGTLRKICQDPEMPARETVIRWVRNDDGRRKLYDLARQAQADWYADEIVELSRDRSNDTFTDAEGRRSANHAAVARDKLICDNLKFLMAKLHPGRYGDRLPEMLPPPSQEGEGKFSISCSPLVQVVMYPVLGRDGTLLKPDTPEYDEVIWAAAKEARDRGEKITTIGVELDENLLSGGTPQQLTPPQLTFEREPLPGGLSDHEWSLMREVLELVKRTIPSDYSSPPAAIFQIIRAALLMHFREIDIPTKTAEAGTTPHD